MHKLLLSLCFILLSSAVNAEVIEKDAIPTAIMDQIYKKHPNALDITAEKKKPFLPRIVKSVF